LSSIFAQIEACFGRKSKMCVHESVHFLCSCPGGRAGTRFSPCWGGRETGGEWDNSVIYSREVGERGSPPQAPPKLFEEICMCRSFLVQKD